MNRFAVFSTRLFLFIVFAGGYGILHDQVTFTIAPEYYRLFKFPQFGVDTQTPPQVFPERFYVSWIGFLASWWMGLFIGLLLGGVAFVYSDGRTMAAALRRAMYTVFLTTLVCAAVGFLLGRFVFAATTDTWWVPHGSTDPEAFVTAGSIHNGSYLGGIIGTVLALLQMWKHRRSAFIPAT